MSQWPGDHAISTNRSGFPSRKLHIFWWNLKAQSWPERLIVSDHTLITAHLPIATAARMFVEIPVIREWAPNPVATVGSQSAESSETPPIPHNLLGRECLYGFAITSQQLDAYLAIHPMDFNPHLCVACNGTTIRDLVDEMDLDVYIEPLDHHDTHILWFAYTKGGVIQDWEIPTPSRLEQFGKKLGLTEQAKWHDAGLAAQSRVIFSLLYSPICLSPSVGMHFRFLSGCRNSAGYIGCGSCPLSQGAQPEILPSITRITGRCGQRWVRGYACRSDQHQLGKAEAP
ncbi:hypothetical protein K438DRAFT_988019 [Mycena galopus ATCC 62051]|nr:hypothetical protein K438DRAFT_988019 [Mycena galopus ATCC 62051]